LGKWNSVKWNETRRIGAILACFYVARVWQRQLGFLVLGSNTAEKLDNTMAWAYMIQSCLNKKNWHYVVAVPQHSCPLYTAGEESWTAWLVGSCSRLTELCNTIVTASHNWTSGWLIYTAAECISCNLLAMMLVSDYYVPRRISHVLCVVL